MARNDDCNAISASVCTVPRCALKTSKILIWADGSCGMNRTGHLASCVAKRGESEASVLWQIMDLSEMPGPLPSFMIEKPVVWAGSRSSSLSNATAPLAMCSILFAGSQLLFDGFSRLAQPVYSSASPVGANETYRGLPTSSAPDSSNRRADHGYSGQVILTLIAPMHGNAPRCAQCRRAKMQ